MHKAQVVYYVDSLWILLFLSLILKFQYILLLRFWTISIRAIPHWHFLWEPSIKWTNNLPQFTRNNRRKKNLTQFCSCWKCTVFLACISLMSLIFSCTFSPYTTRTTLICWSNHTHSPRLCAHTRTLPHRDAELKALLTCSLSWSLLAAQQIGMYPTI